MRFSPKKIIFSREHFKSRYEVALLLLYKSRMHYIPTLDRLDQQKCEGKMFKLLIDCKNWN